MLEKQSRESCMDDIPTAQPALALAQKVLARAEGAGVPADLVPEQVTSVTVAAETDAENALRTAVLEFMDDVRAAERAAAAARRGEDVAEQLDGAPLTAVDADEWRAHWPAGRVERPAE